jgi:putative ABC transport system permease protein
LSSLAFWGAIETGLVFAFVALGVFISFRVLDFPDLTVDGSFPLGAAVAASLIVADVNPWAATAAAFAAGAAAGAFTAFLNVQFRILHLLASILTMFALLSVILRVMGRPNIPLLREETIVTPLYDLPISDMFVRPALALALLVVAVAALTWFFTSNAGLAMRATGANKKMARAQGIATGAYIYLGMAISNGLVGFAGALSAQTTTFADATSGQGRIVEGLAAVIIGQTLIRFRAIWLTLIACIVGAVLYRLALQYALEWDGFCIGEGRCFQVKASDLNIITTIIILFALILPNLRRGFRSS